MKMITMMPDFGMGPYAWERDAADRSTAVGPNIADAVSGFRFTDYRVSGALEADFATWIGLFGGHSHEAGFDWDSFHRQGIALARRLKAELGDQARVVYDTPVEDPSFQTWRGYDVRTEVLAGGRLKLIAFRSEPPNGEEPAGPAVK